MSTLHICYVFRIGQIGTTVPENAEEIYEKSVKKLVGLLYSNPRICASISFSGIMLDWYEKKHPEVMDVLKDLTNRKQVEIIGGGYYDPLFPLLLPVDRLGQIELFQSQLRKTLGKYTNEQLYEIKTEGTTIKIVFLKEYLLPVKSNNAVI